jgi:hypothetical protein
MKPPLATLAPYLPPPPDLTALSDAALARYLDAMAWRWRDGSSDHTWRLLDEAAKRLETKVRV